MTELSDDQKRLVQSSFHALSANVDTTARVFYGHLFAQDPALRGLFKTDLESQGRRLMDMLGVLVVGLDNVSALSGAITLLGRQHLRYGVQRAHFRLFENALLYTVEQVLGEEYTAEVGTAWRAAYRAIEAIIIENAYSD